MRTVFAFCVANIGSIIRIIGIICTFVFSHSMGKGIDDAFGICFMYWLMSVLCSAGAGKGMAVSITGWLFSTVIYIFVSVFVVRDPALTTIFCTVLPLIVLGISVCIAVFAWKWFDEMIDFAFLLNNSAVEHFETQVSYSFNRYCECSSQLKFLFVTVGVFIVEDFF